MGSGQPVRRCDYCRTEDVALKVVGSVETGSGGGYLLYACRPCRESLSTEDDRTALYGSTPHRAPTHMGRKDPA